MSKAAKEQKPAPRHRFRVHFYATDQATAIMTPGHNRSDFRGLEPVV